LLGKSECNEASEDELELLRFLTPLLKLYTAKQAISVCSEGLEGKRIKKKEDTKMNSKLIRLIKKQLLADKDILKKLDFRTY